MSKYSLTHLSDQTLLSNLTMLVSRDRATTAELLAHIAEVDSRKLYLPAACSSMYVYCVRVLGLSEEAARKRIHAARAAREFPVVFSAVADGRLHLSAVILLAPYLTAENSSELLAAAAHKSKSEIERLIAERFPKPDVPVMLQAIAEPAAPSVGGGERAPGRVEAPLENGPKPHSRVAPLSPRRYALQFTISQEAHDLMAYAQTLVSHQAGAGDIGQMFERAFSVWVRHLEKRKFAAASKPRRGPRRSATNARHIPAEVKRAVWARDGGQCTFVRKTGLRCASRTRIEFDHVDPVARGGQATIASMRLRCRAHNQYEAERTFGVGFMHEKREQAQRAAASARSGSVTAPGVERAADVMASGESRRPEQDPESDVTPWLRRLGFRADEARRGAEACERIHGASLEQRLRVALAALAPAHRRVTSHLETAQTAACT